MPQYVEVNGQTVEFPDGMEASAIEAAIKKNIMSIKPAEPQRQQSWLETQTKGLATAPINLYLGTKQFLGGLSPIEQSVLEQNREAEKRAPVASLLSNVATAAPAFFVPGANTVAGAGAVGAINGILQPVDGEQSLGNIAQGKAINTTIGGALGAGGQKGANMLAQYGANRATDAARKQALRSVRDTTLAEGRAAGYIVPNSEVAPSFLGNRLESLGGKAAIKQEAAIRNQQTTNAIARKALNLPDDQPITKGVLDGLRKQYGQAYDEVASLSKQAMKDVEGWKQANAEAKQLFESYNRNGLPDVLKQAKAKRAEAEVLQNWIEWHARSAGKPELVGNLAKARKEIAKTYTVERALNVGTGDVEASVLGRMADKGKPLSDGLETIGKFQQAFPKFTGAGASTPAPGIGKTEALAAALLAGGGVSMSGDPTGALAGVLPLLSHPARAAALSKFMQASPKYGAGQLEQGLLAAGEQLLPRLPFLTGGLLAAE